MATEAHTRRRIFSLVAMLVLCLSAYVQFTVASRSEFANPLVGDAGRYFSYAYNVQRAGIYSQQATLWDPSHDEGALASDNVRSPGYPAFLILLTRVEPTLDWARHVFLWQAMLGVLTVFFTLLLAREVLPDSWALGAAALTAISPHLATITAEILTESLFTCLLVLATWALTKAFRRGSRAWSLAAGALWALAALTRPTAEFLPPLIAAAVFLLPRLRASRPVAVAMLIAFLLVMTPWSVRNHLVNMRPTSENLTVNFLHHGSYPDFMLEAREETLGMPYRFDPKSAVANASIGGAIHNIAANFRRQPLRNLHWYLVGKPTSFLSWNIVGGWGDIFTVRPNRSPFFEQRGFDLMRRVMRILHAPLMVLGLLAGVMAIVRPHRLLGGGATISAALVGTVLVYAVALHMIGAPYPRYGIPFRPIVYTLALLPLAWLVSRAGGGREASG